MTQALQEIDVLVIGAGQAGLAAGYHLARTKLSYLIVDRHARIGDSWRCRYDSLTLFTPRAFSTLPGLTLDGDPQGYPARESLRTISKPMPAISTCPSSPEMAWFSSNVGLMSGSSRKSMMAGT